EDVDPDPYQPDQPDRQLTVTY
ncbi:MAG: hypothetical protein QG671_3542, partial [Actinomycetota bacterium]|nr:hypothetical protein [Actinomycetota bacterium]